jgi:UDP-N-acetylmuramate--alanine ligase
LARFFMQRGAEVRGYDRTETDLTRQLAAEGAAIHYADDQKFTLEGSRPGSVYTGDPSWTIKSWDGIAAESYQVFKRSDVLQWITEAMFAITVAGTHGKTTVSTMIAYLLRETGFGCNAFLGGISSNYESNYWSSDTETAVVEADE